MGLVLGGTGHRPDKLGGYTKPAYEHYFGIAVEALDYLRPDEVISGMALGWDVALAEAAFCLGIPFLAFVPFEGQEGKWNRDDQRLYRNLLKEAHKVVHCCEPGYAVWKMQRRNEMMVDHSDKMLALWNGTEGGTANCVQYAEDCDVPIINLWSVFNGEQDARSMGAYIEHYEVAQAQQKARAGTSWQARGSAHTRKRIRRSQG